MNVPTPNDAFRLLLGQLNPAQRAAVDQIEGPVMVIAGPGTGKTHILAARIGKILLDTDAHAQNILCLTFTDAGATAMRERLVQLIGNEALRVNVHTFHSFCNRVIQENLEHFGGRQNLDAASDLERIEIVRELLVKLPPEHPLRREHKSPYVFEKQLLDLFRLMKTEDWRPGHVQQQAKIYLDSLPTRPEFVYQRSGKGFRKGDLKTEKIAEETQRMERLGAAADLFPKFNTAMERAGRYDYEDMILWVVRAFERNQPLLRGYQERFQYVLVDEFQDTNGAQNQLLRRLVDYWESPNVFIVGDDDQSIYEFQGARLRNLTEFYNQFKTNLLKVVLEENFRSLQPILTVAGRLIAHNEIRAIHKFDVPLEKNLTAARTERFVNFLKVDKSGTQSAPPGQPQILSYENALAELTGIVAEIENLQAAGEPLNEIAVLYAQHKQGERLMTLLEKKGIPFETKRPANVLDLPHIRQLRHLLEYLRDERREAFSGEHRVFELLHFRFWGLAPVDVARLAAARFPERRWREILGDEAFFQPLQIADFQSFKSIFEKLETWLADASELPLPAFLEKIANQSGLLRHLLSLPDRLAHVQALTTFLDFTKRECARNPRFSLEKLLDQLATLDANELSIPLAQHIRTGAAGLQLLTAHGAKGLEFRHVFLLGCSEDFWEKKKGNTSGRFALPDTLTFSTTEDETEAQRRLFYVACTRAKDNLTISFSTRKEDGKAALPSRFLAETGLSISPAEVPTEKISESQTLLLLDAPKPLVTLPEAARLDDLLADFALSPTSFNRFLRCPLAFYYQDVLRVPEATSENAAFGSAMHGALQQLFLLAKRSPGRDFPPETALVEFFEKEMEAARAWFGSEGFRQFLFLGKDYLPRFYRQERPTWSRRSEVERRVAQAEFDGVPLTGVIDRFDRLDGGKIRVVDYKTGVRKPEKTAAPNPKQPHGGDYWRQLMFYKILLETSQPTPETVVAGAISYLEPDRKTGRFPSVEIEYLPEHVAFVKKLLVEVDGQIRRHEFAEGCGEADCAWCRMHRENVVPERFENVEEDLDD